jgi:hypothetical protein
MTSWLKCDVTKGMMPGEFAVVMSISGGRQISLFAAERFVRTDPGRLLVTVVDKKMNEALVYLPSSPFEISSRTVTVPIRELVAE